MRHVCSGVEFVDITGRGTRFEASSDIGSVSWEVPTMQPAYHIDSDGPNHSRVCILCLARELIVN